MKYVLKLLVGILAIAGIIGLSLMGARMLFWFCWHTLKFLFIVFVWVFALLTLGNIISKIFKK